jgi:catechol 2,3-dioxygenase-like lactoylglutathione lyase family enzyme
MELGQLDVCIRIRDVPASRSFYEKLGFKRVEGNDEEGWCVMLNGGARIGLFEEQFMGADAMSLNFRGGNVHEIAAELGKRGLEFDGPVRTSAAGASARLRDPDGHLIFFDALETNVE